MGPNIADLPHRVGSDDQEEDELRHIQLPRWPTMV